MIYVMILSILIIFVMFLTAPSKGKRRAECWRCQPFAHRGLHGDGAAENTMTAFERACAAGFGIELDVQLSRDGELVVFHDDTLKRLTDDPRRVDEVDFHELKSLILPDGGRIPSFSEVLQLVNGRVPLLVELKTGKRNARLCADTAEMLRSYRGKFVVESFHPMILRWFKKNAPEIVRGQLVGARAAYLAFLGQLSARLLSTLSLNFLARPDFVAYDVSAEAFAAPRIQRALYHTPMAAWTVRDEETYQACLRRGEMPIFEGFVPKTNF